MKHRIPASIRQNPPVFHDMRRVGNQSFDDTLALNSELPALFNCDYAAIELRALRPLLGWRWYIRHLLPRWYFNKVVHRG